MISSHLTKNTWLHRTPTLVKLLLLSFVTVLATLIKELIFAFILLLVCSLIFLSLGREAHGKLKNLVKNFGTLVFLVGIFQTFFIPLNLAALMSIKMFSLIMLADLVSITSSLSELKRVILKLLTPLSFIGININKISLTMTLSLRLIQIYIALWKKLDVSLKSRIMHKRKKIKKTYTNNFKIRKLVSPFLFNAHQITINMGNALQARSKK